MTRGVRGGPKGTRYNVTKSDWFDMPVVFEDWFEMGGA